MKFQLTNVKNLWRVDMPKLKTKSGAKKRFKLTKTGKVKYFHANKSHLLTKKSAKRKRSLRKVSYLGSVNEDSIKSLLPYA